MLITKAAMYKLVLKYFKYIIGGSLVVSIIILVKYPSQKNVSSIKEIHPRHKFTPPVTVTPDENRPNPNLQALMKMHEEERKKLEMERNLLEQMKQKLTKEEEALEDEKERLAVAVHLGLAVPLEKQQKQRELEERKEYLKRIGPADPKQFQGLNSTDVRRKYPEIIFLPTYRMKSFIDPKDDTMGMQGKPQSIHDMDDFHAEERFYELVPNVQVECLGLQRIGKEGDGGWDVCVSKPYTPKKDDCLVYSFGIANDFSFDDDMAAKFGCNVRSFDPNMNYADYARSKKVWFYQLGIGAVNTVKEGGWKLETLGSILSKLGDLNKIIDVLKMDIDYNEWEALSGMFRENVLGQVKQIVLEIHTPEVGVIQRPSMKEDYDAMYSTLLELERRGFRRCFVHYNHWGNFLSFRTGKHRTCCYEFAYINLNFL